MDNAFWMLCGALIGAYVNLITAKHIAFLEIKEAAFVAYAQLIEGDTYKRYLSKDWVMDTSFAPIATRFALHGHAAAALQLNDLGQTIDERFHALIKERDYLSDVRAFRDAFFEVVKERGESWSEELNTLGRDWRAFLRIP